MPSDQRPPLINLGAAVPATAGNVYNLVSDEIDSAIEGVRAAFRQRPQEGDRLCPARPAPGRRSCSLPMPFAPPAAPSSASPATI
jgi:hypothetical protein